MIRRNRPAEPDAFKATRPADPAEADLFDKLQAARASIEEVVAGRKKGQGKKGALGSNDFDRLWSLVKSAFAGKCAYCDAAFLNAEHGDIDHYRPKTRVYRYYKPGNRDDTKGAPGRRGKEIHSGYWWLAYTWDNYLLSCSKCNRTWKRDQFPVKDQRTTNVQGDEAREEPLLLNPYDTDPEPHLAYKETGTIQGLTVQGDATIDVCGLDRRTLDLAREDHIRIIRHIYDEYVGHESNKNEERAKANLKMIYDACSDEAPFAGMVRFLIQKWGLPYDVLVAKAKAGTL